MKVSVIIPAYNIDTYITQCVNSVLNQTLTDIEIIIVNDGSTDNTGTVLKEIADKHIDRAVQIIDQENLGLGGARNTGLRYAMGEFIAFLDGDDWLEPTALERMYDAAVSNQVKVVICDYRKVYSSFNEILSGGDIPGNRLDKSEDILLLFLTGKIAISACNKLFSKKLLDEHSFQFPQGYLYEDIPTVKLITDAGAVVKINKAFYNYRQREGSIMNSISPKMIHKFDLVMDIISYSESKGYSGIFRDAIQNFYLNFYVLQLINQLSLYKGEDHVLQRNYIRTVANNKEGNYYFKHFYNNKYINIRDKAGLALIRISPLIYTFLYSCYKRV